MNFTTKGLLVNLSKDSVEFAIFAVLPLLLKPSNQAAPVESRE